MLENLPPWIVPVVLATWGLLLMVLQWRWPLRPWRRQVLPRMVVNVLLSVLAFITAAIAVKPAMAWALRHHPLAGGLLNAVDWPWWLELTLALVAMDLTFYWWHRLNHQVPLLWRFHNVHHCDPELDVTTGFRFHAVEVGYSSAFRVAQIAIIGVSPTAFLVYEICFQISVLFHHSNWWISQRLEKWLRWFIVTPRMHASHHSQQQLEANANYGVVLSCWDRLHRSLVMADLKTIKIGVPAYQRPADNRWWTVLLMPFRHQRDYWNPEAEAAEPDPSDHSLPPPASAN